MSHESRNSTLVVFGDSLSDNGNLFALIGQPAPPAWEGRASNGPTYAEQLAKMLHMRLDDRAFAAAEASDASPPVLVDPATGHALPINLSNQLAGYIADLHGHQAPHHTTVLINIGSNDYQGFLQSENPQTIEEEVQNVVGSIAQAIDTLTHAGVEKIVLFTLPDFGITPAVQALGPEAVEFAHALDVANNTALAQMAASHPNVQVVDVFQLSEAFFADPHSFGFSADLNQTWVGQLAAGSHQFAPNEVAFFDGIHPTTAAHGIVAAFADAVLTSDSTQFLDGTQSVIHAGHGDNFIFATPINPANPALNDDYTIYGGPGADVIFAGSGNVTVHGGSGNDLVAAGSGNATLDGGSGADVLETNSTGTNTLAGGEGSDALIVNRAGTNALFGGSGNDLFVFKESASIVKSNGSFNFGQQVISGGSGHDTLKFIINDQNANAESALIA
ncbi:MAG TPA: SGNH/GDSL hydrolase family protein, partial [Bradyrhizobium sp.]|nr:SGNH/GDSL hydrolase family protein [Bradyrhizobium sp.]